MRRAMRQPALLVLGATTPLGVVSCTLPTISEPRPPVGSRRAAHAGLDPLPVEFYLTFRVADDLRNVLVSDVSRVAWLSPGPNGSPSLSVPLMSLAPESLRLEYRFLWLDAGGATFSRTAWDQIVLHPSQEARVIGAPESGGDRGWVLELRRTD